MSAKAATRRVTVDVRHRQGRGRLTAYVGDQVLGLVEKIEPQSNDSMGWVIVRVPLRSATITTIAEQNEDARRR
ncbi:hypothetical protein [uncultured Brevundimonas sp.]|uniref:hypothetical protein n=1 Tax=uncultured Brevundimonas sp. TaxID=213418 RepID=UPI0025FC35C7|nr:hypothetical protein [uncultured Brevundimonas sp.]